MPLSQARVIPAVKRGGESVKPAVNRGPVARLWHWQAPRPTRCEIATLSDHMLRDIGIDPGRIRPR